MNIPASFCMDDSDCINLISHFPLALLISPIQLTTSFCPMLYLPASHQLVGHLAIGNPLLKAIGESNQLKAMFKGHDGYISASWYTDDQSVPTWNYAALEVSCQARLTDSQETEAILHQQSEFFEKRVGENWQMDKLARQRKQAMLNAIGGFILDIDSWQGIAKYSQNKSAEVRGHLSATIKTRPETQYQLLYEAMTND